MIHYKLSGSSEPRVIGVRNGISQGEIKWSRFKNNETVNIIRQYFSAEKYRRNSNNIEPINFEIEYVEANKSAKLTDFFMFSPALWGIEYFVTDKAKKLLENFHLPQHTYIPVVIHAKDIQYKYWALYVPQHYRDDALIIERCIFNKGNDFKKELVQFGSLDDYKQAGLYKPTRLVFNEKVDQSLDLFATTFTGGAYIISEKLKSGIEKEGLTGVEIQQSFLPELIFE